MSSITQALPAPEIYYHQHGKDYYIQNARGLWIPINEGAVKRHLKSQGYGAAVGEGQALSEVDTSLNRIQLSQDVNYAAPLAGYDAGFYEINNRRILVTDSPRLIEPKEGLWPLLEKLFEGMLVDSIIDQRPYFYGWLKIAITALRTKKWQPGQVVALAGPIRSAKSLCQALITRLLGGRSAQPYTYMTGATSFNADLFVAEHLMIEDVAESIDIRKRRSFGAAIKGLSVNREQHCHGKNQQALTLTPFWRVSISLNDEPERLLVLPPLDEDIADKLMLLKVTRKDMPMPTGTADEMDAFWGALLAELPAFMYYVLNWPIPEALRSPRFGVVHFHHPELVTGLEAQAPELQLMELIDQEFFRGESAAPVSALAVEIQTRLTGENCVYRSQAGSLLHSPSACGTYLARLTGKYPDRITSKRVHGRAYYTIQPPYDIDP